MTFSMTTLWMTALGIKVKNNALPFGECHYADCRGANKIIKTQNVFKLRNSLQKLLSW